MGNCKPVPHKHAEMIKAWADGAAIQFYSSFFETWMDIGPDAPLWEAKVKYRIKPELSDLERYGVEVGDVWTTEGGFTQTIARINVCINKYQTVSGVTCGEHRLKTLLFRRGEVNKL